MTPADLKSFATTCQCPECLGKGFILAPLGTMGYPCEKCNRTGWALGYLPPINGDIYLVRARIFKTTNRGLTVTGETI